MRIRITILFFGIILSWPLSAESQELRPFSTDYCTGFPEGTQDSPSQWRHCCVEHDLYFWAGGRSQERRLADVRLRDCVEATGATQIAKLIFLGVRLGSFSPYKIPEKQWGNGWIDGRAPGPHSQEDRLLIQNELREGHPDLSPELVESFLWNLSSQGYSTR